MSLRIKVFLIIGGVISLIFLLISSVVSDSLTKDFSELEDMEVRDNVGRVRDAFENRLLDLKFKVADWAQWDDPYLFVMGENPSFPETNLNQDIYKAIGINFTLFSNERNEIIFKEYYDDQFNEQSFPPSIEGFFSQDSQFFSRNSTNEGNAGVVVAPEGVYLIVSDAITKTDGTGNSPGFIAFGILFNGESAKKLSQLTHLDVTYSLYNSKNADGFFENARKFLRKDFDIYIEKNDLIGKAAGFCLIKDINGDPALILKTEMDRATFEYGQKNIVNFKIFMVFIGFFFLIIVLFSIELLVLKKLTKLNNEVKKISGSNSTFKKINISGNDEFFHLGNEINKMLDALRAGKIKKQQLEKANTNLEQIVADRTAELEKAKSGLEKAVSERTAELQNKISELKRMNDLMIGRELKMIELKEKISKIENQRNISS